MIYSPSYRHSFAPIVSNSSHCVVATLSGVCVRVRVLALLLPWRRLVLEAEYMQPVDSGRTPDGGRKEGRELSCHTLDGRYIETEPRDERLKRRKPFHRTERLFDHSTARC